MSQTAERVTCLCGREVYLLEHAPQPGEVVMVDDPQHADLNHAVWGEAARWLRQCLQNPWAGLRWG